VSTFELPTGTPTAFVVGGIAYGHGSLWVTDVSSNDLLVRLNPDTGAVEAEISVDFPTDVGVTADAVWVTNYEAFTLTRIDPATNQVVAAIQVGGSPVDLAAADAIWVANRSSGSLSRVDPATNQEVTAIPLFAPGSTSTRIQANEVAVGAGAVWVTDGFTLHRIDPDTNTVVASASVAMTYLAAGESELWISSPPLGVLRVTPAP
jgi:YVTN family beta-propeller protein